MIVLALTYEPIATTTLGSAAASYTFSSIPQTYTDLVLVWNGGNSSAGQALLFQVGNGSVDVGSNYSYTYLNGTGASAVSGRASTQTSALLSWSSPSTTVQDTGIMQFQNYSNTTTNKTVLVRYGNAATGTDAIVNLWRSTSAINTIKIFSTSGNLITGSSLTLFGIKAA